MKGSWSLLLLPLLVSADVLFSSRYTYSTSNTQRNPLRGFVPFGGDGNDPCTLFPCSLENKYIPFISVMSNWNTFDFSIIERTFANVASRGHQTIIRIYVDYPEDNSGSINVRHTYYIIRSKVFQQILPPFLANTVQVIDNGDGTGVHPNYDDANLIKALVQLINALGSKYNGDNRIAVWQVGLLGHWGEWHTWPTTDFASTANQKLILDAFTHSFTQTKLQVRYPNKIGGYAPGQLNAGYYDDSFLEDTYGDQDWYYYNQLSSVGGQDIWKTQIIGGELYPPLQNCAFSGNCATMDWNTCVSLTRPSWMWNNYAFSTGYSGTQKTNALNAAASLGYQIHLSSVQVEQTCNGNTCDVVATVTTVNNGNAPFYYPISLQVATGGSTTSQSLDTTPGQTNTYRLTVSGIKSVSGQALVFSLVSRYVLSQNQVKLATSEANTNGALTVTMPTVGTTRSTTRQDTTQPAPTSQPAPNPTGLNDTFLKYDASNTAGNPQRGFVPFGGDSNNPCNDFPCSMENTYVPFRKLMTGWNQFDFSTLDQVFSNVAKRNHQSIVRVYVDYPDVTKSANGTRMIDNGDGSGVHPDYNSVNLTRALVQLITELGRKYDGDSRIAFWQMGLLGHWGEWHNYPTTDFASTSVQDTILNAFTSSFKVTRLMTRYPNKIGSHNPKDLNAGYYDDSFGEDTYGDQDWYFANQLSSVNANDIWTTQPIGGELYPPYQSCAFDSKPCTRTPFGDTVSKIHASWLWNNYAFQQKYSGDNLIRAKAAEQLLGYQIYLSKFTVTRTSSSIFTVRVDVTNKGTAPFYYPMYLLLTSGASKTKATLDTSSQKTMTYQLRLRGSNNSTAAFTLQSPNVLPGQKIRFANREDSNGAINIKLSV
ncbi:hypothetical protein PROFUN_13233 [Planoprotostelium fungivorum]|uniref:DUF4832 domain-containing protein n=1 Tax=Planoprotostelium fungivorum TaxID=1890364 RepID=A0A2P6N4P4_9EUKA|nr:hypothetical protein PROFUN_13233 [Planoprotostelium fungivorum]